MQYYPAFLDLSDKKCLLAGTGAVGRRKLKALLECAPGKLVVVDPAPLDPAITELIRHHRVDYFNRHFEESDLDGCFLAIAATGSADANAAIADLCRKQNILCNVIDAPASGDFIVPAHFRLDGLCVALSTSGQSPALARAIRQDLQDHLHSRYDALLKLLGRLRPLVLARNTSPDDNSALFRAVVHSNLAQALEKKDSATAGAILGEILPPELRHSIGDLLHELV